MRLINLSGADSVHHPEHGSASVGADGVFDVGPELGGELVKQRGQWVTEAEHVANAARAELLELSDPHKVPEVLASLRAASVKAEARIAELEAQVAKLTPDDGVARFPVEASSELKGAALDAALTEAGLPKTGTADEKRAALAEAATPEPQPRDGAGELIPTPDSTEATSAPSELKGEALTAALEEAGLPKSGTADEKRASLVENADS